MNMKTIVAIAVILIVLGAGYVVARPENGGSRGGMMGQYAGMMSNFGNGIWGSMMGYGNGVSAGYGGMMGYRNGTGYCGAYTGRGYGTNDTP